MFKYAQLNEENVVIGISYLDGEVLDDSVILIDELDIELCSTYNQETGEFTPPEPQPEPEPQPTTEEIQTQILLNTEYLVIVSELSNL